MEWFKTHHSAVYDKKIQSLPPDLFKTWFNILCLCSMSSDRGSVPELEFAAYQLHLDEDLMSEQFEELIRRGLLDVQEDGSLRAHNWETRQTCDSYERVKRKRSAAAAAHNTGSSNGVNNGVTDCNAVKRGETVSNDVKRFETFCNTELDIDLEREVPPFIPPLKKGGESAEPKNEISLGGSPSQSPPETVSENPITPPKRKGRTAAGFTLIPADWTPSPELVTWAETEGASGKPLDRVTAKFRDYWRGKGAMMKDWDATWRNWIRREIEEHPDRFPKPPPPPKPAPRWDPELENLKNKYAGTPVWDVKYQEFLEQRQAQREALERSGSHGVQA